MAVVAGNERKGNRSSEDAPLVLLIDPFGRTKDYDEALYAALEDRGQRVRLLTTAFNERREVEGTGEGYFLRGVAWFERRWPRMPTPLLKGVGALEYLVDVVRLVRMARRQATVLHWQWVPFVPLTVAVIRAGQAGPNLVTAHNVVPHDAESKRLAGRLERLKYRWADRIVVHSARLEGELVRFCPAAAGKSVVIPAGLQHEAMRPLPPQDMRVRLGVPDGVKLIGFVGLMRPYKGAADLLRAWREVQPEASERDGEEWRLIIAGDWSLSGEEDRRELELTKQRDPGIIVLDRYLPEQEYADLLNALDLVVLPYRRASQSGVALGALRFGVPLLVTESGGLPDLMQGPLVQWVVPPSAPTALREGMRRFIQMSDAERADLGAEVSRIGERYAWSALAERYDALYAEITRRGDRSKTPS